MEAIAAFTSPGAQVTLPVAVDINWHIGDVIRRLRKRHRGMNQTKLAEKVGVNKATIVRAEQGDPKVSRDTYIKIATVLGTKLAVLEMEAARLEPEPEKEKRQRDPVPAEQPSGEAAPTKRRHTAG